MEKNRSTKIVAIAALFIAVIGLSIGFAAFSSTLTIQQSAEVTPLATNWDVRFSSSATDFATSNITPVNASDSSTLSAIPATVTSENNAFTADAATLTATTVSGIKVHFTEPGQTATYTFYVVNGGKYDAYLHNVDFKAATGATNNESVVCTAATGSEVNANQLAAACADITYTVTVDSVPYSADATVSTGSAIPKWSGAGDKSSKVVVVTVSYPAGSDIADDAFDIAFGDIDLLYNAVPYSG